MEPVHRRHIGTVLETSSGSSIFKNHCTTCCVNLFSTMDATICDSSFSPGRRWSAVCDRKYRVILYVLWNEKRQDHRILPADKHLGRTLKRAIVARLRRYVAKNQRNWGLLAQLLAYSDSTRAHCMRETPVQPDSFTTASGPATFAPTKGLQTDANSETRTKSLQLRLLPSKVEMWQKAHQQIESRLTTIQTTSWRQCAKNHALVSVSWNTLTAHLSQHLLWAKRPWEDTLNFAHAPLHLIPSLWQRCTLLISTRIELQTLYLETSHMQLQKDIIQDDEHHSLPDTYVRDRGNESAKQGRAKVR